MAGRTVVLWVYLGSIVGLACAKPKEPPKRNDRATPALVAPPPRAAPAAPVAAAAPAPLRVELLALPQARGGDRAAAKELHRRAMAAHRRKDYALAEQTWAEAARADPSWAWPFYNLACVSARTERPADAIAYLEAVRARDPSEDMLRRIATDRDLDSLRETPALASLLAGLSQQVGAAKDERRYARATEAAQALRADGWEPKPLEDLFPDRVVPGAAVPDKLQRRIRFALRSIAKAPIAIRDLIPVPQPDGGLQVFGLYEHSAYEECVRGYDTRAEGKKACLVADYDRIRNNRDCVHLGVWHARVAPAPDGAEGGGRLLVNQEPLVEAGCKVTKLVHYFVADVDRDGELELFGAVVTEERTGGEVRSRGAGPTYYPRDQSNVFLFAAREDSANLAFSAADADEGERGFTAPEEELYELTDLDGDERLDLVRFAPCNRADLPDDGSCAWPSRARTVYLYHRGEDHWQDDHGSTGDNVRTRRID